MRRALLICALLALSPVLFARPTPQGRQDAAAVTAAPPAPKVARLTLAQFPGAWAIWGATGQDSTGHIWFGVAAAYTPEPSAHLLEYDPENGKTTDRGDVIAELRRLGLLRPGEHQAKIHSKIVQGRDGWLYFASMDEEGENDDGSRLPTWGGHFWRFRPATGRWEHLGATPEALIAVATGDRFVYALGYFGHVLYQYDTERGQMRRVQIGSVGGHITRNFLCDYRGHVYVPRLRTESIQAAQKTTVSLVEIGTDLRNVQETPIPADRYLEGSNPTESHGIIALQPMADRSIFFSTHQGYLYKVEPPAPTPGPTSNSPASVTPLGWLHPSGQSYVASLFTTDGARTLVGLAHTAAGSYQWLTCGVAGESCAVAPFQVPGIDAALLNRLALYGSATRDRRGGHYIVGAIPAGQLYEPIALRVEP